MRAPLVTVVVGVTLLTAAGHAQEPPDRGRPPAPAPAPTFRMPPIGRHTLSNGLGVWLVERHDLPIVQVNLVIRGGASADPTGAFGTAGLTSAMLDEGAGTRSALEIADAVDFLGATLSTGSSMDASTLRLLVPVARLREALAVMADVALRPTFPGTELERLRKEGLTRLMQARDNPGAIAAFAFPRVVFGPRHRYGTTESGSAEFWRTVTADDLRTFHARVYQPGRAVLIVVGDVTTDAALPLLEGTFGPWRATAATPAGTTAPPVADAPQLSRREIVLVDKPGAAQSVVAIGGVGVARTTPDYFSLEVLNTVLGGSFTSRLNQNLRETHGYAYGAGSSFVMHRAAGPFIASAAVQTDKTAEAVREFFNEFAGVRTPIPPAELQKAKNYMALGFPAEFESSRQVAGKLEELFVYELPEDEFSTYVGRVQQVTAADVVSAAKRHLRPDTFAVVVVGDRQAVEAPLRALDLGPVRVASVDEFLGHGNEKRGRE